ncbi:MAG: hypothetical protein JW749_04580 [Sedimentisphaerales bacterium]|nr:hypothetical protein [Sedimentisphaerales bacterium]
MRCYPKCSFNRPNNGYCGIVWLGILKAVVDYKLDLVFADWQFNCGIYAVGFVYVSVDCPVPQVGQLIAIFIIRGATV